MSTSTDNRHFFARNLTDDDLHLPEIKQHSLEKIWRHNYVAAMFARAMKNEWHQRAYVGLYSGAGRARLASTGEILETTAMSALRLEDGFTDFVFVDHDPRCIQALQARAATLTPARKATFITGDVDQSVSRVQAAFPRFSKTNRLLTFCFVDPFNAHLKIATLAALASKHQMDFLLLLALGHDVRWNLRTYLTAASGNRIGEMIGDADWRNEFTASRKKIVPFVLEKFDQAMVNLGYLTSRRAHPVKVSGMGVLLYYLAYYSKHELGLKFWNSTLSGMDRQGVLPLPF